MLAPGTVESAEPPLYSQKAEIDPLAGVMGRIAICESSDNPKAANPHSTAKGRFQFLHGTWVAYGTELWGSVEGKDIFSYKDNTELARYVIEKYGTHDWAASKDCWS